MKFYVTFSAQNANAIHKDSRFGGMDLLNAARVATDVPNLDAELVENKIFGLYSCPCVPVPTEQAEKSGHFPTRNSVTVMVPEKFLDGYVKETPDVSKCGNTGKILRVSFQNQIDYPGILSAWENAGFPLNWGVDPVPAEIDLDEE